MLKTQIEEKMKEALKAGQAERLSALRFLYSSIKNAEIDKKREATDEDVIEAVKRQIKQHKESIEAYDKAGRAELKTKEEAELSVLSEFMPEQMSEEELLNIAKEVISGLSEMEKSNFGKVMGAVMARVKGKADGNAVSAVVRNVLGN